MRPKRPDSISPESRPPPMPAISSIFLDWIAAGHAGEMKYLESRDDQGELKRASLARVAPWAKSVIVCAINYNTAHPYSTQVHDSEPRMDLPLRLEPRGLPRRRSPPRETGGSQSA